MAVPQPDQAKDSLDNRSLQSLIDLLVGEVVAVNCAPIIRPADRLVVVVSGKKSNVIDLWNSRGEKLYRPCSHISIVISSESSVVGAIQLVDTEAV
jgi:hypothetical protein